MMSATVWPQMVHESNRENWSSSFQSHLASCSYPPSSETPRGDLLQPSGSQTFLDAPAFDRVGQPIMERDLAPFEPIPGVDRDSEIDSISIPFEDSLAIPEIALQHVWAKNGSLTPNHILNCLVIQVSTDGVKCYFCGWTGCRHPVGFVSKARSMDHIRSVHLGEKPFVCTTCGATFGRKQEAVRHVNAMNGGRIYICSICLQKFYRKYYRDTHEARCASRVNAPHQA